MNRVLCFIIALVVAPLSFASPPLKSVYGASMGADFVDSGPKDNQYLLYLGAFSVKNNAVAYQEKMSELMGTEVKIKHSEDGLYRVYIGPLKNIHALHRTSRKILNPSAPTPPMLAASKPRGVITVSGGPSIISANGNQSYTTTDSNLFVYRSQDQDKTNGFIGGLLGLERDLPYSGSFFQAGLEYTYFGRLSQHGTSTVGIEPATSTGYQYSYQLQTQQALILAKVFSTTKKYSFYPYLLGGIGAASNQVSNFATSTSETGSVNLTPTFTDNQTFNFSYALGVGIEANVREHFRFGLGYRFTDFGRASLSNGRIQLDNTDVPTPFNFNIPHVYANQFLAQLSYLA